MKKNIEKKIDYFDVIKEINEFLKNNVKKTLDIKKIIVTFLISFILYFLAYFLILFFIENKSNSYLNDSKIQEKITNKIKNIKTLKKEWKIKIKWNRNFEINYSLIKTIKNYKDCTNNENFKYENYKKNNYIFICWKNKELKILKIKFNTIKINQFIIFKNYLIFLSSLIIFILILDYRFYINYSIKWIKNKKISKELNQNIIILITKIKQLLWNDSLWLKVLNKKKYMKLMNYWYILYFLMIKYNSTDFSFLRLKQSMYIFIQKYKNIYEIKKYIKLLTTFKLLENYYFLKTKNFYWYIINFFNLIVSNYMTSALTLLFFLNLFILFNSFFLQLIIWWDKNFLYYMYETTSIISNLWWDVNFNSNIWYAYWIYLQFSWILLFWLLIWIFEKRIVI